MTSFKWVSKKGRRWGKFKAPKAVGDATCGRFHDLSGGMGKGRDTFANNPNVWGGKLRHNSSTREQKVLKAGQRFTNDGFNRVVVVSDTQGPVRVKEVKVWGGPNIKSDKKIPF